MLLVSGSLAFDNIFDFPGAFSDHIMADKLHMLNVSFLVDTMRKSFGGTAGNIAYTLSLLHTQVSILGSVGKDFAPYEVFLKKHGVDTSLIHRELTLYTATAFGITDKKDNQLWGFYQGADRISHQLNISAIKEKITFGLIAPNNPKAMCKFAKEYTAYHIPYLFDPGMQLPWLLGTELREAFKGAKIIIGNDYEVSVMEKKTGIRPLTQLSKKGKIIIRTLGEKGSEVSENGKTYSIPAARIKNASDPTGAGDAYRAGFMAGYMRKLNVQTCGQMGSVASAYTVEKYGTTTHSFTVDEFCKRYRENFGETIRLH